MPSPFPGMNPYFESPDRWEDFHQSLAGEIRDQLIPRLRPKYYAALVPRVTSEEVIIQQDPHDAKPDVVNPIHNGFQRGKFYGTPPTGRSTGAA